MIIEDDYDSEYRYAGRPLPSLQGIASDVNVIYMGTFSNVMFPSLRIGYVVLPPALVSPFANAKYLADRQSSSLEQSALVEFIEGGHLDRYVRRMRKIYGERRSALIEAFDREFGDAIVPIGDAAGLHLLAALHLPIDEHQIADRAMKAGVVLGAPLRLPRFDEHVPYFRFSFARLHPRTIREGVRRLAQGLSRRRIG